MTQRLLLSCLLLLAPAARAQEDPAVDFWQQSPEALRDGIEQQHPVAYWVLAQKLFEAGQNDEAVFWFYVGQLRYRFHLTASPDLDPSGDPALFASLMEGLGRPLNEYAFGDLPALQATLERVLGWDEQTENGFTSRTKEAEAWKGTREGLGGLIEYIRANGDDIRTQRTANGLENRN